MNVNKIIEENSISGDDFLKVYLGANNIQEKDVKLNEDDIGRITRAMRMAISEFEKAKEDCNDNSIYNKLEDIIGDFNKTLMKIK